MVAEPNWREALAAARHTLASHPEDPRAWLQAAAALGAGEQWPACLQAAGRAVQGAPRQVGGWVILLRAQAALTQPAPDAAVLAEAVRLHGSDEGLVAAVAVLLARLAPTDAGLPSLAAALWSHRRALEVLRLATHAQADLSALALEAAQATDLPSEAASWAARRLATDPADPAALAALLEISSLSGDFEAAATFGSSLLSHSPQALEQLLLARALVRLDRPDEAAMLLELHLDRRGVVETWARVLGIDAAAHFLELALLDAATERGRGRLVLELVAEVAALLDAAAWQRLADHLDTQGRPLEATLVRTRRPVSAPHPSDHPA